MLKPLKPNGAYICRTAPLTSRRYILYIYSTHISTEYFKHAANSPFFPLQNEVYFIILHCLVPVLFAFYIQSVLKFKCKIQAPKVTCSSLGTIFHPMSINSVPDVKCFCNNKNMLCVQSMVWHFVPHPVYPCKEKKGGISDLCYEPSISLEAENCLTVCITTNCSTKTLYRGVNHSTVQPIIQSYIKPVDYFLHGAASNTRY